MSDESHSPRKSFQENESDCDTDDAVALLRKLEYAGQAECAHGLIRNLNYAHTLTRDINKTLQSKVSRGVDINVSNDIDKSLQRALTGSRDLDRNLQRVHKIIGSIDGQNDLGHIGSLIEAFSSALNHIRDLDQVIAYTLGKLITLHHEHNLHYDRNHFRDFGRIASLVNEINLALVEAQNQSRKLEALHLELYQDNEFAVTDLIEMPSWVKIAPPVRRLVNLTVRFLPAEHQARYEEELRAEIWDLIAAKATRSMQVWYAVLQLSRARRLRQELCAGSKRFQAEILRRAARWLLTSNVRIWPVLTAILLWGGIDTYRDTGLGAAILTIMGGGAVFHALIKGCRILLGVEVQRQRKRAKQLNSLPADPPAK